MNKSFLQIAAISLVLTACSEEGTDTNSQAPGQLTLAGEPAVTPAANPLVGTTSTNPLDSTAPTNTSAGTNPVDSSTGTVTQSDTDGGASTTPAAGDIPLFDGVPITATQTGGDTSGGSSTTGQTVVITNQLVNGTNGQTAASYWRCESLINTDPDAFFLLAFHGDSGGLIQFGENSAHLTWDSNGSNGIYITVEDETGSISMDNISFISDTEFQVDFSVSDSGTAQLLCALYDLNGNPIVEHGQAPILDEPAQGGSTTPASGAGVSVINGPNGQHINNFWFCAISSSDSIILAFANDGTGTYYDSDFEQGLDFSWNDGHGILISLSTGDSVELSTPTFDGANSFQVQSVIVNGVDNGSLSCSRYDDGGNLIS